MTFGEKLRALRYGKDYSQRDLVRHLSVSNQMYSQYELGRALPQDDTVIRQLAEFYNCPISYLSESVEADRRERQKQQVERRVNTVFGKRLEKLRKEKGLTTSQIAKAVGISNREYNRMEMGNERPMDLKDVYEGLASILGCEAEYLSAGDDRLTEPEVVYVERMSEANLAELRKASKAAEQVRDLIRSDIARDLERVIEVVRRGSE